MSVLVSPPEGLKSCGAETAAELLTLSAPGSTLKRLGGTALVLLLLLPPGLSTSTY